MHERYSFACIFYIWRAVYGTPSGVPFPRVCGRPTCAQFRLPVFWEAFIWKGTGVDTMTDSVDNEIPVKAEETNTKPQTIKKAKTRKSTKNKTNQSQPHIKNTGFGIKKAPCYIPLNLVSQCGHEFVLYYNANAPRQAIFDCATSRIKSALHLLEVFGATKNAEAQTLYAVASASSLLLNDALTLLHELNPKAYRIMLKQ